MKISEILMELGDRPRSYEIVQNSPGRFIASSKNITLSMARDRRRRLEIMFMVGGKTSITNKGDAVEILSTVLAILKDNIRSLLDSTIQVVYFTADMDEPSRIKLYDRFQKIMSKLLGDEWQPSESIDEYNKTYRWANISAITKTPESALIYARYTLNGEFPEGEAIIASDVAMAYEYAKYVLRKPFPLGEVLLAKNTEYAYLYATEVLHDRFIKAEPIIATNASIKKRYEAHFGITL